MDGCCKNTCAEECRRRDANDPDWEVRRRRYRLERDQQQQPNWVGGGLIGQTTNALGLVNNMFIGI
jgi:hypothetical protein